MGPQAPDPKAYYGYLLKPDKTPSDTLDALLRAIAKYIITEIGDKDETILTPKKLAAFYRATGGDYDRLFLEMPHNTISYIWSNIGCQHTLQPTENDFLPPSIPALTPRGFVRWSAVEILLDPASHVPFLQHAVQGWALKHPDDGTPFPAPLPADAFPAEPDAKMVRWHEDKLETLRAEGQAEETPQNESPRGTRQRRRSPRRADPKRSDSSSEGSRRGRRSETPRSGDVGGGGGGVHFVYPARPGVRRPAESYFPTVDEEGGFRRRSLSDHASPTDRRRSPEGLRPPRASQTRRYSQPRVNPVIVSSDSEDGGPPVRARAKHGSDPGLHKLPLGRPSVRHAPGGFSSPKRGYSPNLRAPPADVDRRKSFPFGDVKDKLMHTVSGILTGSTGGGAGGKAGERPRSSSRTNSHTSSGYLRPDEYVGRREVESDESEGEYDSSERGRRRRRELERERERGRVKAVQRARERDRDREARDRLKGRTPDMFEDRPLRPNPKRASPYRRGGLHPDGAARREDRDGSREEGRHDRRRRDAHAYRD